MELALMSAAIHHVDAQSTLKNFSDITIATDAQSMVIEHYHSHVVERVKEAESIVHVISRSVVIDQALAVVITVEAIDQADVIAHTEALEATDQADVDNCQSRSN